VCAGSHPRTIGYAAGAAVLVIAGPLLNRYLARLMLTNARQHVTDAPGPGGPWRGLFATDPGDHSRDHAVSTSDGGTRLATHTSGLPRLAPNQPTGGANPYRDVTAERAEEGLRAATRTADAGHVYSNFGYQLLGLVLERASGERYQDLLAERLLRPLGMTCSGAGAAGGGIRLTGHAGGKPAGHWDLALPGPGAVEATIGDLARYLSACQWVTEGQQADSPGSSPTRCSFTTEGLAGSRRPWRSTRPPATRWARS
jgi:Beta-lactamase